MTKIKSTTEFDEIVVYGSRGTTMGILTSLETQWQGRVRVRAMVDDIENGFIHPTLNVPVISAAERAARWGDLPVLITPPQPSLRAKLFTRLVDEGAVLATASTAGLPLVDPVVSFGAGSVVTPHTRIATNVRIGQGSQVLAIMLAHDIDIGSYCSISINSSVLGHVVIGDQVNIAPHAVICNGTRERPLTIGDGAIIGVGAVVTRDVPAGARMVGNPAMTVKEWGQLKRLIKRSEK